MAFLNRHLADMGSSALHIGRHQSCCAAADGLEESWALTRPICAQGYTPAATCTPCSWVYPQEITNWALQWESCTRRLLKGALDARNVWLRGGTDLVCYALRNWNFLGIPRRTRVGLWRYVTAWLKAVQKDGYDLQAYGRLVTAAYASGSDWPQPHTEEGYRAWAIDWNVLVGCRASYPMEACGGKRRLQGLTYGPRLEDWNMARSVDYDEFAGDFWSLTERSEGTETEEVELSLPGAWLEH